MFDQKEAEKKALVDADQPLPSAKSKVLIEQLKNGKIEKISVFERGVADQTDTIRVTSSRSGQTHFINKYERRIMYNALLALLNKSSVRTTGVWYVFGDQIYRLHDRARKKPSGHLRRAECSTRVGFHELRALRLFRFELILSLTN